MLRIAHTRRQRIFFVLWVLTICGHLYALYVPGSGGGALPFAHADKVAHILIFGAVAGAGRIAAISPRWLLATLLVHAVVSEVVQGLWIAGRSGDVFDTVADVVGIWLGWYVAGLVQRYLPALAVHEPVTPGEVLPRGDIAERATFRK